MNDINKLRPGEIHVAAIQIAGEAPYHLILLPDHPKNVMTHQVAAEWAVTVGGDLPTRPEQALLFAHQRDQFEQDWGWYWSNTLHESYPDYAWYQHFINGHQHISHHHDMLRARRTRGKEMIKDEFQKAVDDATPDLLEALRCACNYIDKLGGTSSPYRALLARDTKELKKSVHYYEVK